MAVAAANWQVDRATIMRIRTVAKEGALAALAASKPGVEARKRDYELEALQAENARLAEAVKQMAVKLTLIEGRDGWG
jgi:transposase